MLTPKKLYDLRLIAPSAVGRPWHVSAASGLVRAGEWLYVIADDELHLGVFPVDAREAGTLVPVISGELPSGARARKAAKPDFEVLLLLPPISAFPHGGLLALGSGSKRNRAGGAFLALNASGALVESSTRLLNLSSLMAALGQALGVVNIEGAVLTPAGDRLILLQRGNRGGARNALVEVSLAAVLAPDANIDERPDVRDVGLGDIDGVPLCFTDGAALPDGTIAFTAIAEDTDNAYDDGACVGAAVGVVAPNGELLHLERLAEPLKVEGLVAEVEGAELRLLLVTDADDAAIPAALYSARLPGYPFGRGD